MGANNKVLGMFKDDSAGQQTKEYAATQAKRYDILTDNGREIKKCKGIKKAVVENSLTIDDYKNCIFNHQSQMRQINIIRSRDHYV